jgi:hypothetical protein
LAIDAGFRLKTRIEDRAQLPLERGEQIQYVFWQTDPQRGESITFYCRSSDGEIMERAWLLLIANAWYRHHPAILLVHLHLYPKQC